jgi:hypothetical protein
MADERISIPELRQKVRECEESRRMSPYSHAVAAGWYADDVLALVEAVEAARVVAEWRHFDPVGDAGRQKHADDHDRLDAALARFSFGEEN